ncbi:NAD(P)-dependent oxidoreductase [Geomicrobium sp. JCM 19038]|uniref:NAD(P)-dependent oxidoreductase n=1 Tax=Geomicrobium sp. JCM 19038 TaxID=1460635 RepID=UPI00045F1006|nr:NAD(P)-dependent oxidoreductase [Geomicrobium sp. JCM 19038]GAK07950.1 Rrf2-linked NADH-flavin reductase [Geomicrobium sp. JCM 19038]
MKVAVIGASGKSGRLIMKEALKRGYESTAIVRDRSKVKENVAIIEKDVFELTSNDLEPFDVVVNAFGTTQGDEDQHVKVGNVLIDALKGSTTRLIVVGGAGSLYVDEQKTTQLMYTAEFPEFALATAKGQSENLDVLQNTTNVMWTFISPAAFFDPDGKRTGAYEIGGDLLIVNSTDESYISYEDYAIAVVDEIEQEQHVNQRYTVVGEKA